MPKLSSLTFAYRRKRWEEPSVTIDPHNPSALRDKAGRSQVQGQPKIQSEWKAATSPNLNQINTYEAKTEYLWETVSAVQCSDFAYLWHIFGAEEPWTGDSEEEPEHRKLLVRVYRVLNFKSWLSFNLNSDIPGYSCFQSTFKPLWWWRNLFSMLSWQPFKRYVD